MVWAWDDGADAKVAQLWHLKESLSKSGEVVYGKWYRDRATFFSKRCFRALFRILNPSDAFVFRVREAKALYEALEDTSPLSTKQLKRATEMVGRDFEPEFQKGLRELWRRLLIVGWGEVDDGAFPSLNMAASQHFFESEVREALSLDADQAWKLLKACKGFTDAHRKWLKRIL